MIHQLALVDYLDGESQEYIIFKDDYVPTRSSVNNVLMRFFNMTLNSKQWACLLENNSVDFSTDRRFMEIFYTQYQSTGD